MFYELRMVSISGFETVGPEKDYVAYAPTADAVGEYPRGSVTRGASQRGPTSMRVIRWRR